MAYIEERRLQKLIDDLDECIVDMEVNHLHSFGDYTQMNIEIKRMKAKRAKAAAQLAAHRLGVT